MAAAGIEDQPVPFRPVERCHAAAILAGREWQDLAGQKEQEALVDSGIFQDNHAAPNMSPKVADDFWKRLMGNDIKAKPNEFYYLIELMIE